MMMLGIFTGGQNDTTQLLHKLGKHHMTLNPQHKTDQRWESLDSGCLQLQGLRSENNMCLQLPSLASLLHFWNYTTVSLSGKDLGVSQNFNATAIHTVPKADMAIENKCKTIFAAFLAP